MATASQTRIRVNILPREAAAIVKLRNLGYPINQISHALDRSTSIIHRILHFNYRFGLWRKDLRKSPYLNRRSNAAWRWRMMLKYLPGWMAWILGEEDKPP